MSYTIQDVRRDLGDRLTGRRFITDKLGSKTVELTGSSITLNPEDAEGNYLFGEPNMDYVERELEWYKSQSLYVKDIPGEAPAIWKQVASSEGKINSNYGHLIWSADNYWQYGNTLEELRKNPLSRRAIMIYTRPSMHFDYNKNGMSDFICTNTVQYLIRDRLHAIVNMRSNDAVFGFRNDYHWQLYVQRKLADELGVEVGPMHWQTGSLHVYQRHFFMIDHYNRTGEPSISKSEYREAYPNSQYI